mmetsp:Transcript_87889/g.137626  ORF Transcript_87889/g.137626 Transcript_87889/m.137626 type:complete len:184 (+) Transcript_87889:102-653(+)
MGSDGPLYLRLLGSGCKLWDSPAVLAAVWVSVALTSVAVLSQQQRLAEAATSGEGCTGASSGSPAAFGMWKLRGRVTQDPQMAAALQALDPTAQPEAKQVAIFTLRKMAENIQQHPGDIKYARIKKQNRIFLQNVGSLAGTDNVMRALGFNDLEDAQTWQFKGTDADQQRLSLAFKELNQATV